MPQDSFVVMPALDLLDGKSVRLKKGLRDTAEVMHEDPVEQVGGYVNEGAGWAHLVNLNAAFGDNLDTEGARESQRVLRDLVTEFSGRLRLQVGGGVRSAAVAQELMDMGVSRVVIGSWALSDPDGVCELARRFPERVVVGLDALHGKLAAQGWTESQNDLELIAFAQKLFSGGVRFALHTQIEKDGMLTGVDEDSMAELAKKSGLKVIASGGVSSNDDVLALERRASDGVCGVVVGRALHTGAVQLRSLFRR